MRHDLISLFSFPGLPAVVTLATFMNKTEDGKRCTADGVEMNEALRRLAAAGADVVGFNCSHGPTSMMPLVESAAKSDIGVGLLHAYANQTLCSSKLYQRYYIT